jgi:hypothetical protein
LHALVFHTAPQEEKLSLLQHAGDGVSSALSLESKQLGSMQCRQGRNKGHAAQRVDAVRAKQKKSFAWE